MNFEVGKRYLIHDRFRAGHPLVDAVCLEVSPKGYVKLQFSDGTTTWFPPDSSHILQVVEELPPPPTSKRDFRNDITRE